MRSNVISTMHLDTKCSFNLPSGTGRVWLPYAEAQAGRGGVSMM